MGTRKWVHPPSVCVAEENREAYFHNSDDYCVILSPILSSLTYVHNCACIIKCVCSSVHYLGIKTLSIHYSSESHYDRVYL